jgi:hypothetical protein
MPTKAPSAAPLTFSWDHHSTRPARTLLCVLLSLAAHAVTFLLFQTTYPKPKRQPGPSAQISALDWTLPEHRPLLNRIHARTELLHDHERQLEDITSEILTPDRSKDLLQLIPRRSVPLPPPEN